MFKGKLLKLLIRKVTYTYLSVYEDLLLRNDLIHFHNIRKNADMQISFTPRAWHVATYNIHCTMILYNSIQCMTIGYHFSQYVTIWKRVISTRFSQMQVLLLVFTHAFW